MVKPASKARLLKDIRAGHQRLEEVLGGFTDADMVKRTAPGAWSLKDLLAHITAWEKAFLDWYHTGLKGGKPDKPDFSKPGVLDEVNRQIYEKSRNRKLKDVVNEFRASYHKILVEVESIPEEVMFVTGKYAWTKTLPLVDYIISNTSEHYAGHLPTVASIRKSLKL